MIAHRGASSEVAEHTLPAYLAAIETGADGLECDVRLTRDGHLVCVHDRTVNRTSNGSGIVSELDLAGLQELDFAVLARRAAGLGRRAARPPTRLAYLGRRGAGPGDGRQQPPC